MNVSYNHHLLEALKRWARDIWGSVTFGVIGVICFLWDLIKLPWVFVTAYKSRKEAKKAKALIKEKIHG